MENKVFELTIEEQEKLVDILNDNPKKVSLDGTMFEIKPLRFGTQWLIASEAIKITKKENAAFGDILSSFAVNMPSVIHVIVLAILNDKRRIFKGGIENGEYSEEYNALKDVFMWEVNCPNLATLLLEVLQMIDINSFLQGCQMVKIVKEMMMMKTAEQK